MFAPELQALQFVSYFLNGRIDNVRAAARKGDLGAVSLEMVVLVSALVVGAIAISVILINKAKTEGNSIQTH